MPLIYIQLIFGFVFLIKGADLLVDGAVALAKRLRVSEMVIGLTVVSFGTSAPELGVNIIASSNNNAGLALGNIIGSNIANILLILGIASLLAPLNVKNKTVWQEIPMNLFAAIILAILINDQFLDPHSNCVPVTTDSGGYADLKEGPGSACNILGRGDAVILLIFFMLFVYYIYHQPRSELMQTEEHHMPLWKSLLLIGVGLVGLVLGGEWIVKASVYIAKSIGLSEAVIGITIVGIGTSLPEVVASSMAAYRGKASIAVGNAIGSNIFNVFWVLGISALIRPIPYDSVLNLDISIMACAALLLYLNMFVGKRNQLNFKKGLIFLFLYVSYIAFLLFNSKVFL